MWTGNSNNKKDLDNSCIKADHYNKTSVYNDRYNKIFLYIVKVLCIKYELAICQLFGQYDYFDFVVAPL